MRIDTTGRSSLTVHLPAGLNVRGRVLDLEQTPVAGARIFRLNPAHQDVLQLVATSDESGQFEIRDIAPGTELAARAARFQPSGLETVRESQAGQAEVELELGARGQVLRGRVQHPDGRRVPFAWIALGGKDSGFTSLSKFTLSPDVNLDLGILVPGQTK